MESGIAAPTYLSFSKSSIGEYQAGWRALVEGMADKQQTVSDYFVQALRDHDVPDLKHAVTQMSEQIIGEAKQSKDYLVVERKYRNGAKATLAVRVAPYGQDLYVEWLHYERGVMNWLLIAGVGCLGSIVTAGVGLIIFIPLFFWALAQGHLRREMSHFEKQDSWALRAVVDTSLRQAIDLAGIAKELVREVPAGQGDIPGRPRIF